jgi:hypothetical protein
LFNYAVEMGSGAIICIPSFIKIGSGIQKLIRGIHRHTDSIKMASAAPPGSRKHTNSMTV